MKKIKITELAEKLQITHSAICQWKLNNKIPDGKIFLVAPIIGVSPIKLHKNNDLLFKLMKNNNTKENSEQELPTTLRGE